MQIIAHRGSGGGPDAETTVLAVEHTLCAGADGIEVDVALSAQGMAVCCRGTDIQPPPTRGVTAATNVSEWRGARIQLAERLPLLAEVVSALRGRGSLVVHIRNSRPRVRPPDPTVRAISAATALFRDEADQLVVSSFDPRMLHALHVQAPWIRTALLTNSHTTAADGLAHAYAGRHAELHAHLRTILAAPDTPSRAREIGIKVCCWTVNRPVDAQLLAIAGVDAVISEDPIGLRRAMGRSLQPSAQGWNR